MYNLKQLKACWIKTKTPPIKPKTTIQPKDSSLFMWMGDDLDKDNQNPYKGLPFNWNV